jgi:type IV secretion system protein VirB10
MSAASTDPRPALDSRAIHPVVPLPRAGLSGFGIAVICGALALILFFVLDGNRRAMSAPSKLASSRASAIASPPPLAVPTPVMAPAVPTPPLRFVPGPGSSMATMRQPAPQLFVAPAATNYPPPPPLPMQATLPANSGATEKVIVLDLGRGEAPVVQSSGGDAGKADAIAGDDQAVRATLIRGRSSLVPQGTLIPAVLETPIDSTRAGLVRALVSRDVRGFDGTRVLIPRGSRLLGEAKGDAQPGQRRVLVTWSRLIRPDGIAIRIGSPGADSLGGAGLRGRVNTHFAERFANAVLQSALTIGVNLASRPRDDAVIVGVPGQLGGTVAQMPLFDVPKGPTIKVSKGAEIAVFVSRDLDFGGTAPR